MTARREDELIDSAAKTGALGLVSIVIILGVWAMNPEPSRPPGYTPPPAQYRCFPEDVRQGVEIGMCPDARNQRMLEV